MTAPVSLSSPVSRFGTLPREMIAMIGLLLGLAAFYCIRLWPEWTQNPDLSHGLFAPVIFVLLLWEGLRHGPQCWLRRSPWFSVTVAGTALAGFLLFALAGILAASVAWTHAVVLFLLAASLVSFLLGGLLILADERVRIMPFNWISFTAIFLWLLVAPLPTGTYARLTLTLQQGVTGAVFHALHLLGIPARQHGNLIELATTTVGVEEACSGIRSLLSCVYAGFFFAAWQLRRTSRRVLLIGLAPILALAMNFLRSLLLTLMANAGKNITGFWHDTTGYAILALTSAILAWLAIVLETKTETSSPTGRQPTAGAPKWSLRFFWTALVATAALGSFYFANSRAGTNDGKPAPDLSATLPLQADGWQVTTAQDLYQFSSVLQTTHLLERTYLRPASDGRLNRVTVYLAYWPAGQTTVSRVASHTPDACWPGSGWNNRPTDEPRPILTVPGFKLSPAEHRLFQNGDGVAQHVWFWHIYDGHPINYRDPYSVPALFELALQYGFRRQGDQFFVRISSNQPWSEIAREPLVDEIAFNLTKLGL